MASKLRCGKPIWIQQSIIRRFTITCRVEMGHRGQRVTTSTVTTSPQTIPWCPTASTRSVKLLGTKSSKTPNHPASTSPAAEPTKSHPEKSAARPKTLQPQQSTAEKVLAGNQFLVCTCAPRIARVSTHSSKKTKLWKNRWWRWLTGSRVRLRSTGEIRNRLWRKTSSSLSWSRGGGSLSKIGRWGCKTGLKEK